MAIGRWEMKVESMRMCVLHEYIPRRLFSIDCRLYDMSSF